MLVEDSGRLIPHGKNVAIKCKKRHINLGGRKLSCSYGQFKVLADGGEPKCTKIGKYYAIRLYLTLNLDINVKYDPGVKLRQT